MKSGSDVLDAAARAEAVRIFNAAWGNFPIPAMLLHKNRDIVALNKLYPNPEAKIGQKCFQLTKGTAVCPHCQANEALQAARGLGAISYNWPLQQLRDCYWVALEGFADLYVHFGIDISAYALPELLEKERKIAEEHARRG